MDKNLQSLISLARSGNEDAFSELAEIYTPLLQSMAGNYFEKNTSDALGYEDFLQEARLALFSAVGSFEDGKNVTFGLYAKICVRNRLVSLLRSSRKKVNKRDLKKDATDETVYKLLEKENADGIKTKIRALLSDFEWQVFELYIQKKSYEQMAEELGKSTKSVDNAIFRFKKKLKRLM